MDQLLVVNGPAAQSAIVTSLQQQQLKERRHLQEWIIANPTILGDDVLILTSEYGSWAADTDGALAHDRLDVLAIDDTGRLVVVELKRGTATRDVHLQAITYAALVSRFTVDTLARAHSDFLRRRGEEIDPDEAAERLVDHVGGELDLELLKRPRLVLVASAFPKQVTHTVVWLSEMKIDIDLVQVSVWAVGEHLVAGFSKIYPIPEVEAFTLAPAREETGAVAARVQQRTRSKNAVHLLVDAGLLPDGTSLRMEPAHGTTATIREEIAAWMRDDDRRRWVHWQNKTAGPLRWTVDGAEYSPTGLAEHVFTAVTGRSAAGIQGTAWFVVDDATVPDGVDPDDWAEQQGRSLVELTAGIGPGLRDWTDLHTILAHLPAGRWTTYGDLAAVLGSAAVPVGSHLAKCPSCPNPWRVLNAKGRVSAGFKFTDPTRTESVEDLLAAAGVPLLDGTADPSTRMSHDELRHLLADDQL